MEHMSEIGMTFEPAVCHYTARVGNAMLRLSGYAVSDEQDELDLFVSLYAGVDEVQPIPDSETKKAAEQCLRFLAKAADGTLATRMEESDDTYNLTLTIRGCYDKLDQIRIYVLTDRRAKAKNFKAREYRGRAIKLEVMDVERLYRHWSAGKPRDELTVDFAEVAGGALPCIYVPGEMSEYDYALTALPGEVLRFLYDKYGDRLLEANVRSFLSVTGKVNKGIRETLRNAPEHFMAYNNGIVMIADELRLGHTPDGGPGISWLKGVQIVNGGQSTASLYFSQRKHPNEVDLSRVRVPAKVIVLKTSDPAVEEEFIANISKYANSQNNVKQSDLSANKRFHREVEEFCIDHLLSGRYRTLVLRAGRRQLPDDAGQGGNDAGPASAAAVRHPAGAEDHQDGSGEVRQRLGATAARGQSRRPEELRQIHGENGGDGRQRFRSDTGRDGVQANDRRGDSL